MATWCTERELARVRGWPENELEKRMKDSLRALLQSEVPCPPNAMRVWLGFITRAVAKRGILYEHLPSRLQHDKRLALAAVANDARALRSAPIALREDVDVVLAAVRQSGYSLRHASALMRRNKHVVLAAVANCGEALQWAHASLRGDADVVLEAIAKSPCALYYADDALQQDVEFVLAAVRSCPTCIYYARYHTQNRDVLLAALNDADFDAETDADEIESLLACLCDDDCFMRRVIERCGAALCAASEALCSDRALVLDAVCRHPHALQYASEELRRDRVLVLCALAGEGRVLLDVDPSFASDPVAVRLATASCGLSIRYASPELRSDKMVAVLGLVEHPDAYYELDPLLPADVAWRGDTELLRRMVELHSPEYISYVVGGVCTDRELACAAIERRGEMIQYVSEELQKEFAFVAVSRRPQAMRFIDANLTDRDFVRVAVRLNPAVLQYASDDVRSDAEFVYSLVVHDGELLRYSDDAVAQDRIVVLAAVRNRGTALRWAGDILRADFEVVLAAVANAGMDAAKYITDARVAHDDRIARWACLPRARRAWRRIWAHIALRAITIFWRHATALPRHATMLRGYGIVADSCAPVAYDARICMRLGTTDAAHPPRNWWNAVLTEARDSAP